jgi:hypothetical protein
LEGELELIWETGRQFAVVRYIASHQQLLFRSDKGLGEKTRMEILFGPVQYMNLTTVLYEEFNIYALSEAELMQYSGGLAGIPGGSLKAFGVGGAEIRGVIIASGYISTEDDGTFWEPSTILRFDDK